MSLIKTHEVWTPELFVSSFFGLNYNTRATAEYICDKIVNTCRDYNIPESRKKTRRGRKLEPSWRERRREMRKCIQAYNALPELTYSTDGIGYADGDSKSCRLFHSNMASKNTDHCPHISFEREVDLNGYYKCSESAFIDPEVAFTSDEMEFILDAGVNVFGFPAESPTGVLFFDVCPNSQKDK